MLKLRITILFLSISFLSFSQKHCTNLESKNNFDQLCGLPLANKYGMVKAVKIVYNLKTDSLYFLNARNYQNHYLFCKHWLNYQNGYGNFLLSNYSNTKNRKYLLANINYFSSLEQYILEISPTDLMSGENINKLISKIRSNSYIEDISLITNTPRLNSLKSKYSSKIRTISPEKIYKEISFQAISKYSSIGRLRFIDDIKSQINDISENDIIVIKDSPAYLPIVKGIITTNFQTPLSHISILGQNRKIPICAFRNALKSDKLRKLEGQRVEFSVNSEKYFIRKCKTIEQIKEKEKIILKHNIDLDSLVDIDYIEHNSSIFCGSKAANFGELNKISKKANFKTPENAFVIPFYFYNEHIKKSKSLDLIKKLLSLNINNMELENEYLMKIKTRIKKTQVNPKLIKNIENKLLRSNTYTKFRFRSSTNAEDIVGFSGAGLYKSKTAKLGSNKKTIEAAIKKVWASTWSKEAYYERKYYNIDQHNVFMGILVHRSFPNERVNGVAITKNIYRKHSNGYLVNAQLGDENVVDAKSGINCDQFICFPSQSNRIYKNKTVIDLITYSSLNDNHLVMYENEIQNLADQLFIIQNHFKYKYSKPHFTKMAYDIEFKIDGPNRQLYIKQIRPYNN
ncbi:MAG: PEP/pyruvate-binding domain-containing protein [Marinifilaceae bacterium]|jgi:phosphoenolpyruvate synthase/pyruvate phosphate dikinase|nr:PEP/pyruvate-binding domain-containing protein [Marinifilaceae bacterium]